MAVNKPHIYESGVWFITFTNYKWLPLFAITNSYDLVYKWFDVLKAKGHHIAGYVIMPNHLHLMLAFNCNNKESLNTLVANAKRFMAYGIIDRLRKMGKNDTLNRLAEGVQRTDKIKGQRHRVFEPSFDAKCCDGPKFVQQKLDYMHANPVSKKWELVTELLQYKYSSYFYYGTGRQGIYEVMHCMQLEI